MAAKTVAVMIYCGTVEDENRWFAPRHLAGRMSDAQERLTGDHERLAYYEQVRNKRYELLGKGWYSENTREDVRDKTLRYGLVEVGAVLVRPDVDTNAQVGRYALARDFLAMFNPQLSTEELSQQAAAWRDTHLAEAQLLRVETARLLYSSSKERVNLALPDGRVRVLPPGLSSKLSKEVVVTYTRHHMTNGRLLWLSTSGARVNEADQAALQALGLVINDAELLPDLILTEDGNQLTFVEVVASDGPMEEVRRQALLAVAVAAGISTASVSFLTVYADREHPACKKTLHKVAWNTRVWYASEPDKLVIMQG